MYIFVYIFVLDIIFDDDDKLISNKFQVILGLLFPLYILSLEFKSKEELQLMPQTTEEHMELENEDDDKSDSEKIPDAEVSIFLPLKKTTV